MSDKEVKQQTYSEMSIEDRYKRIEGLWASIESTIAGDKTLNTEQFFITIHKLGSEIDRFIRHYFDAKDPAFVISNTDFLNKVNKIQLMIKVR